MASRATRAAPRRARTARQAVRDEADDRILACVMDVHRLSPAQGALRHKVLRLRLRARRTGVDKAGGPVSRRRLLAALADSADLAEACHAAGVSRGRLLALLACDPAFRTGWADLAGARLLLLDWVLADRAMAALQPVPGSDALPDKAALGLAQWLVEQRARLRGRIEAPGTPAGARAGPQEPLAPRAASTRASAGRMPGAGADAHADADAHPDDDAEIAALIETVRARIEAAEAAAGAGTDVEAGVDGAPGRGAAA